MRFLESSIHINSTWPSFRMHEKQIQWIFLVQFPSMLQTYGLPNYGLRVRSVQLEKTFGWSAVVVKPYHSVPLPLLGPVFVETHAGQLLSRGNQGTEPSGTLKTAAWCKFLQKMVRDDRMWHGRTGRLWHCTTVLYRLFLLHQRLYFGFPALTQLLTIKTNMLQEVEYNTSQVVE